MNQAVQNFLAKNTTDDSELLARRAIKALQELRRLAQNFAVTGRTAFYANSVEGIKASLYGFCVIDAVKRFTFANQVDEGIRDFAPFVRETLAAGGDLDESTIHALSEDAVQFAEGMLETHKPLYRPVATISGIRSVVILRGDFCRQSLQELNPANAN